MDKDNKEEIFFIDSHSHLDSPQFNEDRDSLISNFKNDHIEMVFTIGDSVETSINTVDLVNKYDVLYGAVGIHPHQAKSFNEKSIEKLSLLTSNEKIKAIGEIGLDYHYEFTDRDTQKEVLSYLLEFAISKNKPVVLHTRESDDDLLSVLYDFKDKGLRGVIHCFQSDAIFAKAVLDLGFYISFSGMITFKKAHSIREVVSYVPFDRILSETDSPYLSPHPLRGKRNNPTFVKYVVEKISEIKACSLKKAAYQIKINTCKCFDIKLNL